MAELNYTLSFSDADNGWTSFHSYQPEWMTMMNNFLYTFKNGNLYKHNQNPSRNTYYDIHHKSAITTIFNNEPYQTKQFKTIATNSTSSWETVITSDQGKGHIQADQYEFKEGTWYAYIRRNEDDASVSMISAQGVGNVTTYNAGVLTFTFNVGSIISDGDKLYWLNAGVLTLAGTITAHSNNTITINPTGTPPTNGSFILYMKNSEAESYPTRGTYLEVYFENEDYDYSEIFMITSDVFQSYP
jgi:hypothetical protein